MSSTEAVLVDRLSRKPTASEDDRKLLKKYSCKNVPESFLSWLSNPVEDWDLPLRIIDEIFQE
jgi:hypothetical protein